jgi:hypothetical protein
MTRTELNIASEFTHTPGPRKRNEGQFSGEEFLDDYLRPRFVAAKESNGILHVNLDGAVGYPTSFLEEAFGGLAREFGSKEVRRILEITCIDEPYLLDQIWKYVDRANLIK